MIYSTNQSYTKLSTALGNYKNYYKEGKDPTLTFVIWRYAFVIMYNYGVSGLPINVWTGIVSINWNKDQYQIDTISGTRQPTVSVSDKEITIGSQDDYAVITAYVPT